MQFIISEQEYTEFKEQKEELCRMTHVAQEKEKKLTQVGRLLHEALGETPPGIVNGMDCISLAERVKNKLLEN